MELLKLLNNPPREFTPIPFWFLNGHLTREELQRQLRDFRDHGVYGVVLHPRMGMDAGVGYLSDAFFEFMGAAIETAAALDMRVVLYDEGMYPSGSACGQVVEGHPDLASRGIALVANPLPGDDVLCATERGMLVERFSGGTIRGVHYGEDDGEPHAPLSADILNPETVDRFIALTHEAYWRRFGDHFGKTVVGFFTDEPSILGRNVADMMPWTKGFADLYTRCGGELRDLEALFTGEENAGTRLYHRLILDREGEVYYGRLSRWCEAHGVALMGHPHQSDDIEVERYFHVPGQDLVYRWVSPETGGTAGMDSTMAKCSADAARLMGRVRNSNECFGACNREGNPWYFTGSDMKWFIDYLAVRGVNLFIPHAFYYSLEGQRSAERPPDVGPGSIWWPHYRRWSGYMARLSCLMTCADLHAEIAVLCRNRDLRPQTVAPLFEAQRGFQYLPESVWGECREAGAALVCRGRRYRAVLGEPERFASVSHDAAGVAPDVTCVPPQPDLRVARFIRADAPCWLLVNEGEREIEADLTLPTALPIGAYDLWDGRAYRVEAASGADGVRLRLRLPYRGSLLLFGCDSQAAWLALDEGRSLPPLKGLRFGQLEADAAALKKTYVARLRVNARSLHDKGLSLCVRAEEMAELYVNDVFCGAGFWPPQRFNVPADALREGENVFRLIVTGSLANRYGHAPVWYGLIDAAGEDVETSEFGGF